MPNEMTLTQPTNLAQNSTSMLHKSDSDCDSDCSTSSSSICTVNGTAVSEPNDVPLKEIPPCKPQQAHLNPAGKRTNPKPSKAHKNTKPLTLAKKAEEHLTSAMTTLYQSLLPTPEDSQRRDALIEKLQNILTQEWPEKYIKVHMFGSSVNNLFTPTSDVDICIVTDSEELRNVYTLASCMRKNGMQRVYCIAGAKVPIVRMWDPELKLACDMNVNNPIALRNTELVKAYVALDPRVRPLIMIIKYWTKRRVLNDAGVGGTLSTYTWVNIIINFLQMRSPPVLPVLHQMPDTALTVPCIIDGVDTTFNEDVASLKGYGHRNQETLGGLLFAFFRLFAYEFNYDSHVISIRNGCYLSKSEKGWDFGKHFRAFCIEEPFNPFRNLGNSADECSVEGIREEFKRACDLLSDRADLSLMCQQYTFPSKKQHSEHPKSNKASNQPGKWAWGYLKESKTTEPQPKSSIPTHSEAPGNDKVSPGKTKASPAKSSSSPHDKPNSSQKSKPATKDASSQGAKDPVTDSVQCANSRKYNRGSKPFKPHSMIKPRSDLPAIGAAH
ncbi:Nucleotidyltransferase [Basidiobolus meristosporus CBS 931.73]|uniref:polynucleotide adenylyltransferase n=1 Tax=Basidiobolus meristosporus CBS 931.73 TaxID=1314790 RepID=A0A1Y1Z413_9FUNG|nr:Nucleotidyltransferase [Basidiobolus meristosporus CBS 931.73]|eukprot:ORY04989.1 Nucleotidyltransferase [Basidiobolus meristosporus CBS 931.73]